MRRAARVFIALVAAALPAWGDVDPQTVPQAQRENFEVFRVRCSKCHQLSKPYTVRMSDEAWGRYVQKMMRRPGSGISKESGEKILSFLVWLNASRDASSEPATAPQKNEAPSLVADAGSAPGRQ